MRRGLSKRPALIGAATVAVALVAVLVASRANQGLPLVPSYTVTAEVPNAASLVRGNDARVDGVRVGAVDQITPKLSADGSVMALLRLKLRKGVEPLPVDSTVIVRPKSILGLKYVEITRGDSEETFKNGATIPLKNAKPRPVELDEVLNTFDEPTRAASQVTLREAGNALAGRGIDLNQALVALVPLLGNLTPAMSNLASAGTNLAGFVSQTAQTFALLAPVAEQQGQLFVGLDRTFSALAAVTPYIEQTIAGAPETLDSAIYYLPRQRPYLRNIKRLMVELQPGAQSLREAAPDLASAVHTGIAVFERSPAFNAQLATTFSTLREFSENPAVTLGLRDLTETVTLLDPTLRYITPSQTVCNYMSLFFRNVAGILSEGDSNGTWQRFITIAAPQGRNNEGGPSSAPADGPGIDNHLHVNPYPNTAAPGQTKECEAGNQSYQIGKTVIGKQSGNQSTNTDKDK